MYQHVEEREDKYSLISENSRVQRETHLVEADDARVPARIREHDKIHCRRSSAAIVRCHCLSARTAVIRGTIPPARE